MSHVPEPRSCTFCGYGPFAFNHWYWSTDSRMTAGGSWKCRQRKRFNNAVSIQRRRAHPERGPEMREYTRQYFKAHGRWARYKAYRHIDNKRFGCETISWAEAAVAMGLPCTYCELEVSEGLDRRDNTRGHSSDNVVPCCAVCNTILCDIPAEAKDLLADGLRAARAKGLLDSWIPPQQRR